VRIRTVKPEFWSHPVMARQSDATRLLAIGLLNHADDEGYFYADAALVRSALRTFDDDSKIVLASLQELSCIGYIEIKEHPTHGLLGKIVSFLSHQRVDKPKQSIIKELFDSSTNPRSIQDQSCLDRKGKEGKGKDTILLETEAPAKPVRVREKNPIFDALAEISGTPLDQVTKAAAGQIVSAMRDIKAVAPEVTACEIHRRAGHYRQHFKDATISPSALAKWWGKCSDAPHNGSVNGALMR